MKSTRGRGGLATGRGSGGRPGVAVGIHQVDLAQVERSEPGLDPGAVASYLRYLCVPAPRTIFREVEKLVAKLAAEEKKK